MLTALLLALTAAAGPGDDTLTAVDKASSAAQDAHLWMEMQTEDPRGNVSARSVELWQKGDLLRLLRFSAPSRLAGTGLLVQDPDSVYLYIPAYGRARRVVGTARGDAFVGTDFAIEDLARTGFAHEWTAEVSGEYRLNLTPREGKKTASARIELTWRAQDHLPEVIEHYRADGEMTRRITFDDVRDIDGTPLAHSVTVQDVREGRTTRATVTQAELNQGLDASFFSLTQLKR